MQLSSGCINILTFCLSIREISAESNVSVTPFRKKLAKSFIPFSIARVSKMHGGGDNIQDQETPKDQELGSHDSFSIVKEIADAQ